MSGTNGTITDTLTVPANNDGTGRKVVRLTPLDAQREYVAGGGYAWSARFWRSLPWPIDDLTADFGDDLYERMSLDAQVESDVETAKLAILADGIEITPARKKGEDGFDLAMELRDFCAGVLDALETPLSLILLDMLDAMKLGNKVAEQVYDAPKSGRFAGKMVLKYLNVKPRHSTVFVVDAHLNVQGLLGLVPGQPAPLLLGSMMGDTKESVPPNLLSRRKFAILTWGKRNNDPRGRSILRSAYTPWLFKTQMLPEWMKHLSQFGSASIWATVGENAGQQQQTDANGNPVYDSAGNAVMLDPVASLYNALVAWQNGTVGAFPFGTMLNAVEPQGDGSVFDLAVAFANGEISKAILGQTLSTNESKHQTRAATGSQDDIRVLRSAYGRLVVASMIKFDILRPMIEDNYGEAALELLPNVQLGGTEQQDRATLWTAAAALQTSGLLDPSQLPELDAELTLPARSEESVALAVQMQKQTAQNHLNPPDPTLDPNAPPEPKADPKPGDNAA